MIGKLKFIANLHGIKSSAATMQNIGAPENLLTSKSKQQLWIKKANCLK
jgi:hypothetical protein